MNKNGNVYPIKVISQTIKAHKHTLNFNVLERIGVGMYNPAGLARLFPEEPYEIICHPDVCKQCKEQGQGVQVGCAFPGKKAQRVPRRCPFVTEHGVMQDRLPKED